MAVLPLHPVVRLPACFWQRALNGCFGGPHKRETQVRAEFTNAGVRVDRGSTLRRFKQPTLYLQSRRKKKKKKVDFCVFVCVCVHMKATKTSAKIVQKKSPQCCHCFIALHAHTDMLLHTCLQSSQPLLIGWCNVNK